jgi:hypothetical protein
MNILKILIRLARRCLLGILITYWLVFIFFTIEKLFTESSSSVVRWYRHIDSSVVQRGDAWYLSTWNWKIFLARQVAALAITLTLFFFEHRYVKQKALQLK